MQYTAEPRQPKRSVNNREAQGERRLKRGSQCSPTAGPTTHREKTRQKADATTGSGRSQLDQAT